jgi:two-component system KDP operon response regulator KdpE
VKTKILIIADDTNEHNEFLQLFPSDGYQICSTSNGGGVMFQFYLNQPDLIIFDLPEQVAEGRRALRQIRERASVPVIALTPRDDTTAKVGYLDDGADQCMVVPFDMRELEARVRALIRRTPVRRSAHWDFEPFASEGR